MAKRLLSVCWTRNLMLRTKCQATPFVFHKERVVCLNSPCTILECPLKRYVTSTTSIEAESKVEKEESLLTKLKKKIPWPDVPSTRLKIAGYMLYDSIVLTVDYDEWFKTCELPDTFVSWFAVTEIHVWLLMVRSMAEDKDGKSGEGRVLRNSIVSALWADVEKRVDRIGPENKSKSKKQIPALSEQFQAAIIGYDEGLIVSAVPGENLNKDMIADVILAAAIWRRIFEKDVKDAIKVENVVRFIRKQLVRLDAVSSADLKNHKTVKVKWLSLKDNNK